MTTPPFPVTVPPPPPRRRVFDLLVIVLVAWGLLAVAWHVARTRGRAEEVLLATSGAAPLQPESPELQFPLPLETFGMVLTRQHVKGEAAQALATLDRRCREALASADEWVLSLAVSPEEQRLLDSLAGTEPLPAPSDQTAPSAPLFPLTQPIGRAGVRGGNGSGAATGRRLICWGFILSDGAEGYTVWFAQPREKLPRSVAREGHAP